MDVLYGVRITGPLAPHARGMADELARLGFTDVSARCQLGLVAHLSRWLAAAGLGTAALTVSMAEAYLAARRAAGYTVYLTPKALAPLLGYLRGLGVAPEAEITASAAPAEIALERYRCYLLAERGLLPAARVARGYVDSVRPFVARWAGAGNADLAELTAGEVTAFLIGQSRRLAPKTAQGLATALRSLLRFWHLQGLISGPLDRAVPRVANRRPGLPRPLEPGQVQALLASCDRETAAGRRDLAMLTLMARMGLRAGEVAGLRLDDIDWRLGSLTVRGKGNRRDQLPLPADAGEAVAAYLRHGRPATALDRSVFIRVKAPHRGLTSARGHPGGGRRGPAGRAGHESTRTGCGTAPPRPSSPKAGPWPRSVRYCGTGGLSPRRHTPR